MAFTVQEQGKGWATVCLVAEREGVWRWKTCSVYLAAVDGKHGVVQSFCGFLFSQFPVND